VERKEYDSNLCKGIARYGKLSDYRAGKKIKSDSAWNSCDINVCEILRYIKLIEKNYGVSYNFDMSFGI